MTSRANFTYKIEDGDGNITLDRTIDPSVFTIFKNGASYPYSVVNNAEGSYYFQISGSGVYSVYVNGQVQDEFQNCFLGDVDIITEARVDNTTINIDGNGKLSVVNGDSLLRTTDLATTFTTASDKPVSSGLITTISASIALKEPRDINILKESDIVNDFSTGGVNKPQSAESLKVDFSGTYFLKGFTDYQSALQELDRKAYQLLEETLDTSYISFNYTSQLTKTANNVVMKIGQTQNTFGVKMPRAGIVKAISVIYNVSAYSVVSGPAYTSQWRLFKNNSITDFTLEHIIPQQTGTFTKTGYGNVRFASGDTLTLKYSAINGTNDTFAANNMALLVRIES